ncbi:MAG: hypothetical protein AUK06_00475 [Parcubacteria group bacterium CG2_30_36_18]|nr:MAG: hypothetical protein AUK06_00475 [Parcubacteria group bacterium CG2_30_36_18]
MSQTVKTRRPSGFKTLLSSNNAFFLNSSEGIVCKTAIEKTLSKLLFGNGKFKLSATKKLF